MSVSGGGLLPLLPDPEGRDRHAAQAAHGQPDLRHRRVLTDGCWHRATGQPGNSSARGGGGIRMSVEINFGPLGRKVQDGLIKHKVLFYTGFEDREASPCLFTRAATSQL